MDAVERDGVDGSCPVATRPRSFRRQNIRPTALRSLSRFCLQQLLQRRLALAVGNDPLPLVEVSTRLGLSEATWTMQRGCEAWSNAHCQIVAWPGVRRKASGLPRAPAVSTLVLRLSADADCRSVHLPPFAGSWTADLSHACFRSGPWPAVASNCQRLSGPLPGIRLRPTLRRCAGACA